MCHPIHQGPRTSEGADLQSSNPPSSSPSGTSGGADLQSSNPPSSPPSRTSDGADLQSSNPPSSPPSKISEGADLQSSNPPSSKSEGADLESSNPPSSPPSRTSEGADLQSSNPPSSPPSSPWTDIVKNLNGQLSTLKENFVPRVLVHKIFTQMFQYINVQLFNSLLLRQECCTFSNGQNVKSGLDELERWCAQAGEEYVGSAWNELNQTRQAVGFLVLHQKTRISYDEITNDLCPVLSVQQLYRICTLYGNENQETPGVSPEVISSMKALMTGDSEDDSNAYVMDDNSSIPFSIEEISGSLDVKEFSDVKPAAELLENPDFQFLRE